MASLRVFVSSTCYDLSAIRGQIRSFISDIGYEPIMSDYNDVLYDPRIHTHTSCIEEIATCDVLILIVGSRFGGKAIPEAISKIDFDNLTNKSKSVDFLKKKDNISVTQLEVLKAVEYEMPIFTFIDNRLWNDHELYEKNKSKPILKDIEFPSIEKRETAEFIFEFVNFLRHRTKGNSINTFSKFEEIESTLKKQWAGLFQKLLNENRSNNLDVKRIDIISNQLEDLKTAILTSIKGSNEKDIANGVVRYRKLIDFIRSFRLKSFDSFLNSDINWFDFISNELSVQSFLNLEDMSIGYVNNTYRSMWIKSDETFFLIRYSFEIIDELKSEFEDFTKLKPETRKIIFDALSEIRTGMFLTRFVKQNFRDYLEKMREAGEINNANYSDEDGSN